MKKVLDNKSAQTSFVLGLFLKRIYSRVIKDYFYNHMCRSLVIDDIVDVYSTIKTDISDITLEKISESEIRILLDEYCAIEIFMKNNHSDKKVLSIKDCDKFPGIFIFGNYFNDFFNDLNEENIVQFIKEKIYFKSQSLEDYYVDLYLKILKPYIDESLFQLKEIVIPSICFD